MSVITQEYDIDLKATGEYPVVKMSQFDTGSRTIVFTVYDGHELAQIDGMVARVDGTRSDGAEFSSTCTVGTGSKVSFTISQEMTKCAGKHAAELVIFDASGNPVGTQNFIIEVEPSTMLRDSAANADDRTLYDQFTGSVTKAVADKMSSVNKTVSDKMSYVDKTVSDQIGSVNKTVSDKMSYVDAQLANIDSKIENIAETRINKRFGTYVVGAGITKGTWYNDYTWNFCRLRVAGGICTLTFSATRKANPWAAKAWESAHVLTLPDGFGSLGDLNIPIVSNGSAEPNNNVVLQIIGTKVSIRPTVNVTYGTNTWFHASVSWVLDSKPSSDEDSQMPDDVVQGSDDQPAASGGTDMTVSGSL